MSEATTKKKGGEPALRDKACLLHQQRRLKQATLFTHKDSADLLPLDGLKRLGTTKDLQPHSIVQRRLMEGGISRPRAEALGAVCPVRSPLADHKDGDGSGDGGDGCRGDGEKQRSEEQRSESTPDDSTEERESPEESEPSLRSEEEEKEEEEEEEEEEERGGEGGGHQAGPGRGGNRGGDGEPGAAGCPGRTMQAKPPLPPLLILMVV
ncbi:hypothetical protein NHX12_020498 [Muraenolepis orangiensis]|uniref:Uncharacterized protein n=1 Tax=Muraenolepis orangiensis TaxID=630683 RepID=A0A9Q0IT25_9TELE|nr:hypothetical protein NHX12_020498 [Muraenolepis orangiensis]